jgi:hypothetical protein
VMIIFDRFTNLMSGSPKQTREQHENWPTPNNYTRNVIGEILYTKYGILREKSAHKYRQHTQFPLHRK